ncbi:MAG: [LysW]-aminoadipate/[LysW]-glutamate kinase [Thermoplasmataceae archaeon]|jgi:acetylglutamate/LysW-gamma-L-alpha-aminoadipate kinase
MVTVVKVGGSIASSGVPDSLIKEIAYYENDRIVLVHGGGPAVTDLTMRLGIEPRFVTSPDGVRSRYTDAQTMEVFLMAMKGRINTDIVLALRKYGRNSVGITGIDAGLMVAERKSRLKILSGNGRPMFVDGGYTGRITEVNSAFLNGIMDLGQLPVIAPIAVSKDGEALNVDGDRAAAAIAGSLKADLLVLLTNVTGVMRGDSLVPHIAGTELDEAIRGVGNGMDKKLIAAREALASGAGRVVISSGTISNPLENAIQGKMKTVIEK